jgi:hypothetical protein
VNDKWNEKEPEKRLVAIAVAVGPSGKEHPFKITGGKYGGACGGGTYFYESLTNTLSGGKYKGKIELP